MASIIALLASLLLLAGTPAEAKAPYCLAGDPCFPSEAVLNAFNATVNGRLIKSEPYGAACYKASYNAAKCQALAKNKGVSEFRLTLPAGLQFTNFEQTDDLKGCPVPDLKPDGSAPDPVDGECTLGRMSHYVVNATNADDIAKSVQFAAKYNLRFRVKNTGHCYTGRSSGEGSFSVWTHYLNDAKFVKDFVPIGAHCAPQDVISAGPGVNVLGLYTAANDNGVNTIGGFYPTVGAAGGYIIGGGTGPLVPHHGLGVDNVVQFEVVTADGVKRIANQAVNSDIFWALRGGGSAFAVVTRVYIKAHAPFTTVNAIAGQIVCNDHASFSTLVSDVVDLQLPLRQADQTGIWETIPATRTLALLSFEMFTAKQTTKPANETLKAFQGVSSIPGCQAQLGAYQLTGTSAWLNTYTHIIVPPIESGATTGVALADVSRIVTNDVLHDQAKLDKIKRFITEFPAPFIWQNAVGNATNKVAPDATAVHPAFRNSFAFIDTPIFGNWTGLTPEVHSLVNEASQLLTDAFGPQVYYNEQYPTGEEWQQAQFGSNYARLLKIKKKVDPNGLFNCRNCVGSEDGY